jgi:hypothetical protein
MFSHSTNVASLFSVLMSALIFSLSMAEVARRRKATPDSGGARNQGGGLRSVPCAVKVAFWTKNFPPGSRSSFIDPCEVSIECRQRSRRQLGESLS